MLDYNFVTQKIQEAIDSYSKKISGNDADFYAGIVYDLQKELDNLKSLGQQNATQQDLIAAWEAYLECEQKSKFKFYRDNRFAFIAVIALIGVVGANILKSLRKQKT